MKPNILICPIKRLYQRLRECSTEGIAAVISTSGDAPDPERLHGIPYIYTIYRDIDYDRPGAFTDEDAAQFAAFIRNLGPENDTLYCCCDAAQSRSPAVAAAASRYYGIDMMDSIWRNPHYKPNMLVFEKLSRALGVPVTDEELDMLQYESRQAFRIAIAQARKHT